MGQTLEKLQSYIERAEFLTALKIWQKYCPIFPIGQCISEVYIYVYPSLHGPKIHWLKL